MANFMIIFKTVCLAMVEIFLLGAFGFILFKKKIIDESSLGFLTRLIVGFILPLFIFTKTIKSFSFSLYPNWWVFPLIGLAINLTGFVIAYFWLRLFKIVNQASEKRQFASLVGFQNSGYMPLLLVAILFSSPEAQQMYIYIFLLLLGFNLAIWSFGVWFLSGRHLKHFELGSMFSPPVIATIFSLLLISLGLDRFIPEFIYHPAKLLGECLLPLAMITIGGNLASVSLRNVEKKAIANIVILKLILLPAIALIVFWYFRLEYIIGLLVILQAAMPSATTLSLIARHYSLEDKLINHSVFFTHLFCILSIPLWLIVYGIFAFFR